MKQLQGIRKRFTSEGYRLMAEIGHSGFGHVFKAVQLKTNRTVAVNVVSFDDDICSREKKFMVTMFNRETDFVRRIQHPNIARLLDKGQLDDELYFAVFDYIEGQPLSELLSEPSAITALESKHVMSSVLDALICGHEFGIVHRDIKPSNIMVTSSSGGFRVTILDFGISALFGDLRRKRQLQQVQAGEALLKPRYSAPEQFSGKGVTARSDLYSWALVFTECVCGVSAIRDKALCVGVSLPDYDDDVVTDIIDESSVGELLRRVLLKKVRAPELKYELQKVDFSIVKNTPMTPKALTLPTVKDVGIAFDTARSASNEGSLNDVSQSQYDFNVERKYLSVLCVSFKVIVHDDNGVNSAFLDSLRRSQIAQCIEIAEFYSGYYVGKLADTVMFYFGYPSASENDAKSAARAALDIKRSACSNNVLYRQRYGVEIAPHIGCHCGYASCTSGEVPDGQVANTVVEMSRVANHGSIVCSSEIKNKLEKNSCFEEFTSYSTKSNVSSDLLFCLTGEREKEA